MTPAEEDAFVARYLDHDTEGRPNGFAKIMTDEEFRLAIRAAYAKGLADASQSFVANTGYPAMRVETDAIDTGRGE